MKQKKDVGESHRCCSRSPFLHPANMSDKPRVYQGVRVKTTVKELLQRHRAREADNTSLKASRMDIPSLCAGLSTMQNHCVDATTAMQADAAYSVLLQGSHVYTQQQQQQYAEGILPAASGYAVDVGSCGGESTILPPSTFPSLAASHGQLSPEADTFSGMAASSSPDSLKFSSPVDHNNYSPQHSSFSSSSSSSCYDSPTRLEPGFHAFPAEDHYHFQHCIFPDCYCQLQSHCWPAQQESFCTAAEYASYTYYGPSTTSTTSTTTDYSCAYPAEDNYLKRDLPIMSSDMCYNIL